MNNTLRAIIIEDEVNGQEVLVALLKRHCPQLTVVGIAGSVKVGFELIREQEPDLVFLDIILEDGTGFELLDSLQPADFQVIFTTSLESRAVEAFRANAVHYLMKPIISSELHIAVERAEKLILSKKTENIITIRSTDGWDIIKKKDIIYLQGDGACCNFIRKDKPKIMAAKNLGYYLPRFSEELFYKTHQSYLANLEHIERILPGDNQVQMSNGDMISLSRANRAGLFAHFA